MNSNTYLDNKKNVLNYFKNHQFEKVIKFGRKLLKKNNDLQLCYALGISYLSLKNYSQAEKTFKNVVLLKPSAENYYIYGNIHKQLENFTEAAKFFEEALNLKSDYSDAYNNLGNVKKKLGLIKEAIVDLNANQRI